MDTIGYFSNPATLTTLNQLEPNRYDYVILDKTVNSVRLPDVQQQLTSIKFINITNINVLLKDINGIDIITSRPGTSIELVPNPAFNSYIISSTTETSGTNTDAPLVPVLRGPDVNDNKGLWSTTNFGPGLLWHAFNDVRDDVWVVGDDNPNDNYISNSMKFNVTRISFILKNPNTTVTHITITGGAPPGALLFDQDVNFTGENIAHTFLLTGRGYVNYYGFGFTITGSGAKEIKNIQLYGSY